MDEEEYVPRALTDDRREEIERAANVRFDPNAWVLLQVTVDSYVDDSCCNVRRPLFQADAAKLENLAQRLGGCAEELESLPWELQARLGMFSTDDDPEPLATEVRRLRSLERKITNHLQKVGRRARGSRHSTADEVFVAHVKDLLDDQLGKTRLYYNDKHRASLVLLFETLFKYLPDEKRKRLVSPSAAAKLATRVAPVMEWVDPEWIEADRKRWEAIEDGTATLKLDAPSKAHTSVR